jgi:hypothetical protein
MDLGLVISDVCDHQRNTEDINRLRHLPEHDDADQRGGSNDSVSARSRATPSASSQGIELAPLLLTARSSRCSVCIGRRENPPSVLAGARHSEELNRVGSALDAVPPASLISDA